ncbi:MAG TPA: hypothetical protein DCZ71_08220 [Ruminococcus sp.]|nr:hypothetical protein [Ruminococcus sp.]
MNDVLRTAHGKGYDKMAVLELLDQLNCIMMQFQENAVSRYDAVKQMTDIRCAAELPLKHGGFVEEDVDNYISDLISSI